MSTTATDKQQIGKLAGLSTEQQERAGSIATVSGTTALLDFLIALSTDPEALRNYQRNPDQAMSAAGLSAADRTLLVQGNQHQLKAALAAACGSDVNCPVSRPRELAQPGLALEFHAPAPTPRKP